MFSAVQFGSLAALVGLLSCAPTSSHPLAASGQAIESTSTRLSTAQSWAISYAELAPGDYLNDLDILIVDHRHYESSDALRRPGGSLLFGYVSIGEIAESHPKFPTTKRGGLLREPLPRWKSWRVRACHPDWLAIVDQEFAQVQRMNFDGILVDTVDSALIDCEHQTERLFEAVQAFKSRSDLALAINSSEAAARLLAPLYEVLLVESLWSADEITGTRRTAKERQSYLKFITQAIPPRVTVLHLEYSHEKNAPSWLQYTKTRGFLPQLAPQHLQQKAVSPWGSNRPRSTNR